MNKSLLAVMAIMPTLLVGCKSESDSVKGIVLEPSTITITGESGTAEFWICPKPSSAKLNSKKVKFMAGAGFKFNFKGAGEKPGSLRVEAKHESATAGTYNVKISYVNVSSDLIVTYTESN